MDIQLDCLVFLDVIARRIGSPMRAHRLRCLWQWPRPSATDFAGQAGVIDGDTPEIHGARIRLGGGRRRRALSLWAEGRQRSITTSNLQFSARHPPIRFEIAL